MIHQRNSKGSDTKRRSFRSVYNEPGARKSAVAAAFAVTGAHVHQSNAAGRQSIAPVGNLPPVAHYMHLFGPKLERRAALWKEADQVMEASILSLLQT